MRLSRSLVDEFIRLCARFVRALGVSKGKSAEESGMIHFDEFRPPLPMPPNDLGLLRQQFRVGRSGGVCREVQYPKPRDLTSGDYRRLLMKMRAGTASPSERAAFAKEHEKARERLAPLTAALTRSGFFDRLAEQQ